MKSGTGSIIASCFALSAFAVALVAGLLSQNDALTILLRAVVALVVCYTVGLIVGSMCDRTAKREAARLAAAMEASVAEAMDERIDTAPEQNVDNEELLAV